MLNDQKINIECGKKAILELETEEVLRIISLLMRYNTDHQDVSMIAELMNYVLNQFDDYKEGRCLDEKL